MPSSKTKPGVYDRFVKATEDCKPRIIGASFGEEKVGKTTFWLGAPGPIVIFNLDQGLEGVVEKFQVEKDIYVSEIKWAPTDQLDQDEAIELRDTFAADFEHILKSTDAKTIIIDKESDLWELYRYAEFGAPKDAPLNYPSLNQRYRRVMNLPKAYGVNFGLIQGMKDEWAPKVNPKTGAQGAASTGARKRWGFKELPSIVNVNIEHSRHAGEFRIAVGGTRGPGSENVADQTFTNSSFVELGMLMFPGTSEDDWL
jgi:hypothetical protein